MKRIFALAITLLLLTLAVIPSTARADGPTTVPSIPANPAQFYALYDSAGPTDEDGYWVWNYVSFVSTGDNEYSSHIWQPHWEWYGQRTIDAFKSLLINPDNFQLEMLVDPNYDGIKAEALRIAYQQPVAPLSEDRSLSMVR